MSVLPAGQPLQQFLPDLEDFLYDPRRYLQHAVVVIGPRRMYGLAALFAIPGIAFILSCIAYGPGDGERLALGVGFLVGAGVWFFWSLMMRGHSLVLHPEGVEVKYHATTVWCPWALFNAEGQPFVPDIDSPRLGLTLPIAREAIPFVELRRNDSQVAFGPHVGGPQFRFNGVDEVVLPARYEVVAKELGELLLALGQRLGRELPRLSPPREAFDDTSLHAVDVEPDAGGWITVPMSRLEFPGLCAGCMQETDQKVHFPVGIRGSGLADLFVPQLRTLQVAVPLCEVCQRQLIDRHQRGIVGGSILGSFVGLAVAWLLAQQQGQLIVPALLGGLAIGGLVGYVIGGLLGFRPPVQLKRFSPAGGMVSLRCRDSAYTALVLDRIRSRARRG
jgi:hypothetical protein